MVRHKGAGPASARIRTQWSERDQSWPRSSVYTCFVHSYLELSVAARSRHGCIWNRRNPSDTSRFFDASRREPQISRVDVFFLESTRECHIPRRGSQTEATIVPLQSSGVSSLSLSLESTQIRRYLAEHNNADLFTISECSGLRFDFVNK